MAKWMTISDAVEKFDLFDMFSDIVESYMDNIDDHSAIELELYDLLEEHEEEYEFVPDSDGDYAESFERNLREAVSIIFDEHGISEMLLDEYPDDDDIDDDEIVGIYDSEFEQGVEQNEVDLDDMDEPEEEY